MEEKVFVRRASGLVREISPFGALALALIMPGILQTYYLGSWGAGLFPDAYMPDSNYVILTLIPVMATYYLMSVAMPRSGGAYIYCSRILSPVIGFIASWTFVIVFWSWAGNVAMLCILYGPGPDFIYQGWLTGNQALVDIGMNIIGNPHILFVLSTIATILMGVFMLAGAKWTVRIMYIAWIAAIIGIIAQAVILLSLPSLDVYKANLYELTGVSYDEVINTARSLGHPGTFTLLGTLAAGFSWCMLATLGSTEVTAVAGEIKEVSRAFPLALFGSLILELVHWLAVYHLAFDIPGSLFVSSACYLNIMGENPFVVEPTFNFLTVPAARALNMPILQSIVDYCYMISDWAIGFGGVFFSTRMVFAWGFDRVFPALACKVNKKGVPWGSILIGTIGTEIWTFFNCYMPQVLKVCSYTITVWGFGFMFIGLAAMVFPHRRKDIFEKSPGVVKKKLLGVPVVSIVGLLTLIEGFAIAYSTSLPVTTGGYEVVSYFTTIFVMMIVPIFIYYGFKYYRKRQGIDVGLAFQEIPPD